MKKYVPDIVRQATEMRAKLEEQIPGAVEMVYDNWNGLVIGFGATERPSEAIVSLLLQPEWVTLCFLKGAKLRDPKKLLKGSGNIVRSMRLQSPADLDRAEVRELVAQSVKLSPKPFSGDGGLVIKSVSAKQRPRRRN